MLVEISGLGLHSHQIGGFDSKELAKFLRLPNTVIPMAMMAVGRTSEEPSKDRKRKTVESSRFKIKIVCRIAAICLFT